MKENLEVWEKIFKNKEWGKYPPIPLVRFIATNYYSAPERSKVNILELGSGTGANLWYLAREGFKIFGIEYSDSGIKKTYQRLISEGLSQSIGEIICGDYLDKIDIFHDNFFDAIIDIESLYCNSFEKVKAIINKCVKKLKQGGRIFSMHFADGTWGMSGEEEDYHMLCPTEGPLQGFGLQRYTTKDDIFKLFETGNTEIEFIHREDYYYSDKYAIKQWIISVKKA